MWQLLGWNSRKAVPPVPLRPWGSRLGGRGSQISQHLPEPTGNPLSLRAQPVLPCEVTVLHHFSLKLGGACQGGRGRCGALCTSRCRPDHHSRAWQRADARSGDCVCRLRLLSPQWSPAPEHGQLRPRYRTVQVSSDGVGHLRAKGTGHRLPPKN